MHAPPFWVHAAPWCCLRPPCPHVPHATHVSLTLPPHVTILALHPQHVPCALIPTACAQSPTSPQLGPCLMESLFSALSPAWGQPDPLLRSPRFLLGSPWSLSLPGPQGAPGPGGHPDSWGHPGPCHHHSSSHHPNPQDNSDHHPRSHPGPGGHPDTSPSRYLNPWGQPGLGGPPVPVTAPVPRPTPSRAASYFCRRFPRSSARLSLSISTRALALFSCSTWRRSSRSSSW